MIVYFSIGNNTHRLAEKFNVEKLRLVDGWETIGKEYILFAPTYSRIAKPITRFLNDAQNRSFIRGVVGCGNMGFFQDFAKAGDIISQKCGVPLIHKVELSGTNLDIQIINEGYDKWCK